MATIGRFSENPAGNHLDGSGDHGSDKARDKRTTSMRDGWGMRDDLEIETRTDWQIDLYQGARRLLVDT